MSRGKRGYDGAGPGPSKGALGQREPGEAVEYVRRNPGGSPGHAGAGAGKREKGASGASGKGFGGTMFDKPVIIIAAMARNRAIGYEGRVPWDLPADMRRFRRLTMGCPVIVGQRTCDGFDRPLDGRTVIVLGREGKPVQVGGRTVDSAVLDALEAAGNAPGKRIWIAGGAVTYRRTMGLATGIDLAVVDTEVAADTWMPEIDPGVWQEAARRPGPSGGPEGLTSTIVQYLRRTQTAERSTEAPATVDWE